MNFPELYKNMPLFDNVEIMHLYYIDKSFLRNLINPEIKYTWIHKFPVLGIEWQELKWPIFGEMNIPFLSRQTEMDLIIETNKLDTVYSSIENEYTKIIQMNKIPPYYLRLESVQGKERYRLLNEIEYYFELDNGGGQEWGTLTSSNPEFWEKLNTNPNIDWNKMTKPNEF
ncbi:MAG: hypothetical protein QM737_18885 [Ferruginibacter sp.]